MGTSTSGRFEPYGTFAALNSSTSRSRSNTEAERYAKREDFFSAGVRLVWQSDPQTRTAEVYTRVEQADVILAETDSLDGGSVLSGFRLSLLQLFAELDRAG